MLLLTLFYRTSANTWSCGRIIVSHTAATDVEVRGRSLHM
jgi:hypothetical protein